MICCWKSQGDIFANIVNSNVIQVYNIHKNESLYKIPLTFHLQTEYSTISMFTPIKVISNKTRSKKRKVEVKQSYFVCGCKMGNLFIFKENGTFVKEIVTGFNEEILAVMFLSPNSLFVLVKPNKINIISNVIDDGMKSNISPVKNLNMSKKSIKNICLSDKFICLGSEGMISIFDLNVHKLAFSFQTSHININGSNIMKITDDSRFILTASFSDRYLFLFDTESNRTYSFSIQSNVISVDLRINNQRALQILVLSESGFVYIWNIEDLDNINFDSKVLIKTTLFNNRLIKIIQARFDYKYQDRINIASGTIYNPKFYSITFFKMSDNGEIVFNDINFKVSNKSRENVGIDNSRDISFNKNEGEIIQGEINMNEALARFKSTFGEKKEITLIDDDDDDDDQNEDDDVKMKDDDDDDDKDAEMKDVPQLDISNQLFEALKYNDKPLIDTLVLETRDSNLINATVEGLTTKLSVLLLETIITKFKEYNNSDNSSLVKWLNTLFFYHSKDIIEIPNISRKLTPLYQSLKARVEILPKLLDISGRLDLVLSLGGYQQIGLDTNDNIDIDFSNEQKVQFQKSNLEIINEEDDEVQEEDIQPRAFGGEDDDDEDDDDDDDDEYFDGDDEDDEEDDQFSFQIDENEMIDE